MTGPPFYNRVSGKRAYASAPVHAKAELRSAAVLLACGMHARTSSRVPKERVPTLRGQAHMLAKGSNAADGRATAFLEFCVALAMALAGVGSIPSRPFGCDQV